LAGLKENVIVGRLIPAGTGFAAHLAAVVAKPALPAPEPEAETADTPVPQAENPS
jgi:hypothetical protein